MKDTAYQEALAKLNKEQKQAVTTIDGPVSVLAGPGTGKTQILTLRIAHIIHTLGADTADTILALTFTNAGVRSMRERLAGFTGSEIAYRVSISTFHTFANDVITRHPEYFKKQSRKEIASQIQQFEIIESILDNKIAFGPLKPMYDAHDYTNPIVSALDTIKREGYTPESFETLVYSAHDEALKDESLYYKTNTKNGKKGEVKKKDLRTLEKKKEKCLALAEIYRHYQEDLDKQMLFDYTDLLLVVLAELDTNPEFKADIQEQYQYILVDEHQDTNDAQNRLITHLIDNPANEGKPDIFIVGDTKQSIFRFAGASEASYKALQNNFSSMQHITLQTNYRSGQHVLDTAYQIITESDSHKDEAELLSHFKHEGVVETRGFSNYKYELFWIAEHIKQSISDGQKPEEIAILYRKNKFAVEVREVLDTYGIPYQDFSKQNILLNKEIKKLFFLFGAISNLMDNKALATALYIDFLEVHPFSVAKVLVRSQVAKKEIRKSIYSIISDKELLAELEVPKVDIERLYKFSVFLADANSKSKNEPFQVFFNHIIRESGFLAHMLVGTKGAYNLKVLERFYDEVRKESLKNDKYSLDDFMTHISILKKHNLTLEITADTIPGVQLLTYHGSKGLEFDNVYMYHATESRQGGGNKISLPIKTFDETFDNDERRLFFVAMTRARKNLYISHSLTDKQGKELSASRFILDQTLFKPVDVSDFEKESVMKVENLFTAQGSVSLSLLDPEYVQARFLSRPLSVSALNNYADSPVKYFFRNLLLLPDSTSDTLEFGSASHAVLEEFYRVAKNDKQVPSVRTLMAIIDEVVEKPRWEIFRPNLEKLLVPYIEHYQKSLLVPEEIELGVHGIEFPINGGQIMLTGKIDKIEQRDGKYVVVDYKTGKTYSDTTRSEKKESFWRQGVFYVLLLNEYHGGVYKTRTVEFDFLEKNSDGEYERYVIEVTDQDIERLKQEITNFAEDIMSGNFANRLYLRDDSIKEYLDLFDILKQ